MTRLPLLAADLVVVEVTAVVKALEDGDGAEAGERAAETVAEE